MNAKPSKPGIFISTCLSSLIICLGPALYLQALGFLISGVFSWPFLILRWGFIVFSFSFAFFFHHTTSDINKRAWAAGIISLACASALAMLLSDRNDFAVLFSLGFVYALLIKLDVLLTNIPNRFTRIFLHLFLALLASFPVFAILQIGSRFSEEELYAFFIIPALAILWLLLLGAYKIASKQIDAQNDKLSKWRITQTTIFVTSVALLLAIILITVINYQDSFYPRETSIYPGITPEQPFLCSQAPPDAQTYDGERVLEQIIELVIANPEKESIEYASLALATGEKQWAEAFKSSILAEARLELFTKPANSVKSIQYQASFRIYFYARMVQSFEGLFNPEEEEMLRDWFAKINQRAQTVEWIDWMYALAFSKWPEGPYENQDIGLGLLSLLESHELAEPSLSVKNRAYLSENQRGWSSRFRYIDDAYFYQQIWINNAYYQNLYYREADPITMSRSFEWLLLQAIPNGTPTQYNLPFPVATISAFYLGADILEDERFMWLAGRAAEYWLSQGDYLTAQPGLDRYVDLPGRSPTTGSCLIYGDSGLPNQIGPLAPDKIVMRDGWGTDSHYLLLNLRFTGWHRYKATNTINLVYQAEPIIQDNLKNQENSWLPEGRRLVRDKRIPRENLNGLIIERSSLSKVISTLTGIGGQWAQDPPPYAEINAFQTSSQVDFAHTTIADWHGWKHDRYVYFYHAGPIVILDTATGPVGRRAAIAWHIPGQFKKDNHRFRRFGGENTAEIVFLSNDDPNLEFETQLYNGQVWDVKYLAGQDGSISLITIFLTRDWVGAEAKIIQNQGQPVLKLSKDRAVIETPLGAAP